MTTPLLDWKEVLKILRRNGFEWASQTGSHVTVKNRETGRFATVPKHSPIKRGTLRSIMEQSGIPESEFR
jgi:predicted RNA binding protein YcfA (HicA-like mRNA interferase family)